MMGRFLVVGLLSAGVAMGQVTRPAAPAAAVPAAPSKALAFDVISIRQNTAPMGPQMGPPQFGPTPDGYRAPGIPLLLPIVTAYIPTAGASFFTPDHIKGLPEWAMRDRYDIQAKVADEDMPEWQKPASQPAMLRAMLQALLADRCKIAVHREVKEDAVYAMVVGKNGPKFKPTNPDETHEGMKLPFGGTISQTKDGMALYAAPMSSLAAMLSSMGPMGQNRRQIQDKTGLTGLYDIVLTRADMGKMGSPGPQDGTAASDPGGGSSALLEALGLKLESTRAPVETLVIDHIEKPTAD